MPVSHVSVVDLTVRTTEPTTLDGIFAAVKKETAEQAPFEELVAICAEETVSTDHTKSFFSAIIDAPSCIQLNPHFFKILAYYDNEMGYAARMVDIVHWVHQQEVKHAALTMKGFLPQWCRPSRQPVRRRPRLRRRNKARACLALVSGYASFIIIPQRAHTFALLFVSICLFLSSFSECHHLPSVCGVHAGDKHCHCPPAPRPLLCRSIVPLPRVSEENRLRQLYLLLLLFRVRDILPGDPSVTEWCVDLSMYSSGPFAWKAVAAARISS